MTENITALVITYNEENNLERCLSKLTWLKHVLVLDSFSTDQTISIARKFPNVMLLERTFDNLSNQCNFGLGHIKTPWALSLDADFILTDTLIAEMKALDLSDKNRGYAADFIYCIDGEPLRASLFPARVVLFRLADGSYYQDGHTHRLSFKGEIKTLAGKIHHDDRKSCERWKYDQTRHAEAEAMYLKQSSFKDLNFQDKIRKMIFFAPLLILIYCLFVKGLILDGRKGWAYAMQRTYAEVLLSCNLLKCLFKGN